MDSKIDYKLYKDWLLVTITGTYNADDWKDLKFFKTLIAQCQTTGCQKILIDARELKGDIPIIERFEYGENIALVSEGNYIFAMVGPKEQILPDKFFENVATNRGAIVKVTADIDEAHQWLETK